MYLITAFFVPLLLCINAQGKRGKHQIELFPSYCTNNQEYVFKERVCGLEGFLLQTIQNMFIKHKKPKYSRCVKIYKVHFWGRLFFGLGYFT